MAFCNGCCRDECICETATPELRSEMLAALIVKGYDPESRLGPQLNLDTPHGLGNLAKHLAAQGVLLGRFTLKSDGTVEVVPEKSH